MKVRSFGKKAAAVLMAAMVSCTMMLSSCGGEKKAKPVQIGVIVSDVTSEEALGFRAYYEKYIASNYNVVFKYSEQLANAEEEKSAIEKFAAQGCKAIISIASSDRVTQLQTCTDYKLYYAIASGMLEDAQFEELKSNPYFVGQIGPSMDTEFQAGLEMGKYFKEKGVKSVAMYGAFIPNPMHVYRAAGIIVGLGNTYGGTDNPGAIVGQIFGDSRVNVAKIDGPVKFTACFQGYGETTTDELNAAIQSNPEAFLSVGMASTFFASQLASAGIDFTDIDSFTSGNGASMKTGTLVYLAGKYSSCIGPIFAATYNAINGNAIRAEGNTAISLSQGYLVAKNAADFDKFYTSDSGDAPIFDKAKLDTVIGSNVSYQTFKSLVENN